MLWRKINLELLFKSGLVYRFFIFCAQTLFLWAITGEFKPAFGASAIWNGINLLLYYVYHYMFYKMFKMGKVYNSAVEDYVAAATQKGQ